MAAAALRKQCAINYDNILKRKKAKLEELKRTFARAEGVGLPEDAKRLSREAVARGRARHQSKVDEMQEIVDEMIANREHRIDQMMARFLRGLFRFRLMRSALP